MRRESAPDDTGEKQARGPGGRFVKGASGNPAGRPKGARNRISQVCMDLLGDDAELIMARLVKAAKKGEPVALRLAVERLLPARAARDRVVEFPVGGVMEAADLAAAAAAVIEQAAKGNITLSEAKEFMSLIESRRKTIETADLAVRIEALESSAKAEEEEKARGRRPMGFARELRPGGDDDGADEDLGERVRRLVRRGGVSREGEE